MLSDSFSAISSDYCHFFCSSHPSPPSYNKNALITRSRHTNPIMKLWSLAASAGNRLRSELRLLSLAIFYFLIKD